MNMAIRAVWVIEIPCKAAASGSCADARSAQPNRVRLRKYHSALNKTTAATIT